MVQQRKARALVERSVKSYESYLAAKKTNESTGPRIRRRMEMTVEDMRHVLHCEFCCCDSVLPGYD